MIKRWGYYVVLFKDKHVKVKLLVLSPKKQFSLQRHKFRSEYWVVFDGYGEVTLDYSSVFLKEGQSIYIKRNQLHRLKNPSEKKLRIIEIQYGVVLKESDIERFDEHENEKGAIMLKKIDFAKIKDLLPKSIVKEDKK